MKRMLAMVLALAMLCCLTACGKSENVKNYEAMLEAVGEVTVESDEAIKAAEDAYELLTDEEKEKVDNGKDVVALREQYKEACATARVNAVEKLIEEIGEVTAESKDKLEAAEKAYNDLVNEEQERVSNRAVLTDARANYDKAVLQEKASKVVAAIDAIGTVTAESKQAISDARSAYNKLTAQEKELVTNFSTLEAAEKQLDSLRESIRVQAVQDHSPNYRVEYDKMQGITWYMHNSMPEYIDVRSYLIPYIGVSDSGNAWICIRYNYTGDDWIFWKSATVMADGEKNFLIPSSYFDIVHDNDGGLVWEWYDECLDYNAAMDSAKIDMLNRIANSSETIVRFQGDDYYYDLTVTQEDKALIREVLTFYEKLI